MLHVLISKNVRHIIDTAGPNFYQFINFTTKYTVSKWEGKEKLWGYQMFWSLSRIRSRKRFSLVLDIPPRHPRVRPEGGFIQKVFIKFKYAY